MTFEDDEIRSRLRVDLASERSLGAAPVALAHLRPRLHRARRRRRIAIGTTSVLLIGVTGSAVLARVDTRSSSSVRTYGADVLTTGDDARTAGSDPTGRRDPSPEPERSSPSESSTATTLAEPSTSTSAPGPASPGVGVPATPIPGPTTLPVPETTTIPVVETSTPTADTVEIPPAPSTSQVPSVPTTTNHRIDSACGAVVVQTIDGRVELVEVLANAGFAIDVKSDGPENVEVGLHGGDDECELKARIIGGQLVTEVHGPDGAADDD